MLQYFFGYLSILLSVSRYFYGNSSGGEHSHGRIKQGAEDHFSYFRRFVQMDDEFQVFTFYDCETGPRSVRSIVTSLSICQTESCLVSSQYIIVAENIACPSHCIIDGKWFSCQQIAIQWLVGNFAQHLAVFESSSFQVDVSFKHERLFIQCRTVSRFAAVCGVSDFRIRVECFQQYHQRTIFIRMRIDVYVEEVEAGFGIHDFQTFKFGNHAFAETLPVFVGIQCPSRFRDCHRTWEGLIIYPVGSLHIFSPEVALHTDDMLFHQFVGIIRNRIVAISLLQRCVSADGSRGNFRIFLIEVQISIRHGSHDCVVSCFGRVQSAFNATP